MERDGGRTRRRLLSLVLLTGLIVFIMAGVALAASSQDIYDNYVANGKLTVNYSDEDLNAVLTDPTLAQYADPEELNKLKDVIRTSEEETRSVFPFTGSQMLLIFGAGVALVGGGVLLRRGQRKSS